MSVTVEKTTYGSWGSCIRISNGETELFCTVDLGPRIIRYGVIGKPNMFFEDTELKLTKDFSELKLYKDPIWRIYGGHRLWVSPEVYPYTYYTDSHSVDYEIIENGVVLNQCDQEYNNLSMSMVVTMAENGEVTVDHRVTNIGAWEVELAPWALTVMSQKGVEVVPQPTTDTGLLANRVLSIWPYTDMGDPRVNWGKKFISLKQDPTATEAFKFGINCEHGYAAYFNHGCLFTKQYNHEPDGIYPDYGVSYETYTSNMILEMESLGELMLLKPSESMGHTETWNLYNNVEIPELCDDKIEETMNKYIK